MLTVDDFARIRLAHRDGMSIREISRRFGWARQSVRKAIVTAEPARYSARKKTTKPKLGAFTGVIDQILKDDESAPPKQRHLATQIFERLVREHGYSGGYDQVRRYVQQLRRKTPELFVPLCHDPGQRAECDFGHIHVDFPDGRRLVPVFLMTWAHSHYAFAMALPTERTESILLGMTTAFEFFQRVPREIWWDNPKTVAPAILQGRERTLHERYRALASHYNFEPRFCMPARGNEKPHVESRVFRLQRRWATPVPSFRDLADLNAYLRRRCEEDLDRTVQGYDQSIGIRFAEDRDNSLSLPERPFAPCILRPGVVDKFQTVRFQSNLYSVPRACAFETVGVQATPHEVAIVWKGEVVARHVRSYGRHEQVLEPLHYLVTLGRKPALLDHTNVYRDWKLPAEFAMLRSELSRQRGERAGVREYIRVLQLLDQHPAERLARAIDRCNLRGSLDVEHVIIEAERLREGSPPAADLSHCSEEVQRTTSVRTGLTHFYQLLSQGESGHAGP